MLQLLDLLLCLSQLLLGQLPHLLVILLLQKSHAVLRVLLRLLILLIGVHDGS